MNLEQAGHFIRHPQELQLSHAEALKNLASRNPYSSVYALLYLTALANGKSPELDDALSAYAYRLSDRTRLYHLLTQSGTTDIIDIPDEPVTMEERTIEAVAEEPVVSITEPAEAVEEEETRPDETHEETERKTEIEIGFDFEKVTTAHSLGQFLDIPESEPAIEEVSEIESSEEAKSETEEDKVPVKESGTEDKKSFTSWLRSAGAPVKPVEPVVSRPNANELIDRFIKEEPSITRSKTEFFSPSKKAKESLSEDTAPVSETLAKIYAAQGNYPKAIHVYHQLMLSVPEKKSLFAVRIEELKKKITQ